MENEELNKKLARWRWPDAISIQVTSSTLEIGFSNNSFILIDWFTKSLDACFKWLVPKLTFCHIYTSGKDEWYATVNNDERFPAQNEIAETPALALCKAIEKLIDKKDV